MKTVYEGHSVSYIVTTAFGNFQPIAGRVRIEHGVVLVEPMAWAIAKIDLADAQRFVDLHAAPDALVFRVPLEHINIQLPVLFSALEHHEG